MAAPVPRVGLRGPGQRKGSMQGGKNQRLRMGFRQTGHILGGGNDSPGSLHPAPGCCLQGVLPQWLRAGGCIQVLPLGEWALEV